MAKSGYAQFRRDRLIQAKSYLGDTCVKCNSLEDLQFDHIDPDTKSFKISVSLHGDKKFWTEVDKCQLLCLSCHQEKTSQENSEKAAVKRIHGTYAMYDFEYRFGDVCEECRLARNEYVRRYRERKKE